MIDKEKWIWIGIAILLVFILGMFFQKNYGLFAGGCLSEESTMTYATEDVYADNPQAQSFIPDIDGTTSTLRLMIHKSSYTAGPIADLVVELKKDLTGTALWSKTIPASQIDTANGNIIGMESTASVTKGTTYYIVASSSGNLNSAYKWSYYAGGIDSYPDGNAWYESSTGWKDRATRDYWFVIDICGQIELTCSQQGGFVCDATQTCTNWLTATDTTRCCNDPCQSASCTSGQTQSCTASNTCTGTRTCTSGAWGACTTTLQKCTDGTCLATCPTPCTDTCVSKGFNCGTQTICNSQINCGTCTTGKTCSSGKCISQPECSGIPIGSFCLAWWMLILLLILLYFMFKKK